MQTHGTIDVQITGEGIDIPFTFQFANRYTLCVMLNTFERKMFRRICGSTQEGGCISDWGTRRRNWLRHCATRQKVAGSIPDGVIGNFYDIILPALGLT